MTKDVNTSYPSAISLVDVFPTKRLAEQSNKTKFKASVRSSARRKTLNLYLEKNDVKHYKQNQIAANYINRNMQYLFCDTR